MRAVYNKLRIRIVESGDESGIALITVVAFMVMAALVTAVLLTVTLANISTTANQRAGIAAQAASDAGIERVIAWLDGVSDVDDNGLRVKRTYGSILNGELPPYSVEIIGDFEVTLTYTYRVLNNFTIQERSVLGPDDNPLALIVTSVARPAEGEWARPLMSSRATVAEISFMPKHPGFDKALFNGGSSELEITNNMNLIPSEEAAENGEADAHVYSNGSVHCKTQVPLGGTIYAQGNITMDNNCKTLSTLWAGGGVRLADGVRISGDVYAAGGGVNNNPTLSVNWSNGAAVAGNVIGRYDVNLQQGHPANICGSAPNANVCKSVVSYEGSVLAQNNPRVGGDVVARNNIMFTGSYNSATSIYGNATAITGNIVSASNNANNGSLVGGYIRAGGTTQIHPNQGNKGISCQNGPTVLPSNCGGYTLQFPTLTPTGYADNSFPDGLFQTTLGPGGVEVPNFQAGISGPPREMMPRIAGPQVAPPTGDDDVQVYDPWVGWNVINATSCEQAERVLAPRGGQGGYGTSDTVVIVTGCDRQLKWDQNDHFRITGNLAIVSPHGFFIQNGGSLQMTVADGDPDLFWIVPADIKDTGNNAIWPAGALPPGNCNRDIDITGGLNLGSQKFGWLMYTPCEIYVQNQWNGTFRGQFYGGRVSIPQNSTIQMRPVPVPAEPSLPDPEADIDASITGRYNIPLPN